MKIKIEKDYISVVSSNLTWLCGLWSGSPKLARAASFFPFIIFRAEEEKVPWILNHEKIHFQQQLETAFIGLLILDALETLYAVLTQRKSFAEAYRWRASEQEAYRNQNNPEYLKSRKTWRLFHYLLDKKAFVFGSPGEIIFTSDLDTSVSH